jgi:heptosyltransferase I
MKIAIVKLSALGDIIHAMVVLQFIKNYNQQIKVDWIVEESYRELLEYHPDINKVHVVNLKNAKKKKSIYLLLKEFSKARQFGSYDMVIDMQGLIKSSIIANLIKSPITLGFDKSSVRESLASVFYNKSFKYKYSDNIIERNLALIEFGLGLNYNKESLKNKLPYLYSSKTSIVNSLSNVKKNILIVPGASFKSKQYSVIKFNALTKELDANFLIIWGNQKEKSDAYKIKGSGLNVSICDKLSISSLVSLIDQVDLVIGADTGPTHIAWALNKPSITLFGPTPGLRNAYVTKINKIIESDSEVNPYKINKKDYSINTIDVRQIVKLALELLKKS